MKKISDVLGVVTNAGVSLWDAENYFVEIKNETTGKILTVDHIVVDTDSKVIVVKVK